MSNLVTVELVILDVNRKPMKGFPILTNYVGSRRKAQKISDAHGNISVPISPDRDFEIHILTISDTFELNATLSSTRASRHRQKIVLPNPKTAYLSKTKIVMTDRDDKPDTNGKFKMIYMNTSSIKQLGADGTYFVQSLIGELVMINALQVDGTEINPVVTFSSIRMNGGTITKKLPLHIDNPTTAPQEPAHAHPPVTPPTTGHISLEGAHRVACEVTSFNEGAIHPNDPNDQYKILAGNGDQQGMSWGMVQWNFGQNTLGPLLKKMVLKNLQSFDACFNSPLQRDSLKTALNDPVNHHTNNVPSQMSWAIDMQNVAHRVEWKSIFNKMGEVPDFQEIQFESTFNYRDIVLSDIKWMQSKLPTLVVQIPLYMYCALFD
jgi:hypothetical protein